MRFVFASDVHNKINQVDFPKGDILLVSGDLTMKGTIAELEHFNADCQLIKYKFGFKRIICCPGNHDFAFEEKYDDAIKTVTNYTYLHDREIEIDGIRIYGSGWTPRFYDWAFNVTRGPNIREKWKKIPEGIDILITHGPPMGIRDITREGHVGCADLAEELKRVKPRVVSFGHIHESYGITNTDDITYINASTCNRRYEPVNPPIVLDLEPKDVSGKTNL